MTPLLWPVWWRPHAASFSRMTTGAPGSASRTARAVANPTIPPPTTTVAITLAPLRCRFGANGTGGDQGGSRRHGARGSPGGEPSRPPQPDVPLGDGERAEAGGVAQGVGLAQPAAGGEGGEAARRRALPPAGG